MVISDSLNHSSIVAGVRGSGAQVKVFSHNGKGGQRCPQRILCGQLKYATSVVPSCRTISPGAGAEGVYCRGPAPYAASVEEDCYHRRGGIQHGGRDMPAARDRGTEKKVQGKKRGCEAAPTGLARPPAGVAAWSPTEGCVSFLVWVCDPGAGLPVPGRGPQYRSHWGGGQGGLPAVGGGPR